MASVALVGMAGPAVAQVPPLPDVRTPSVFPATPNPYTPDSPSDYEAPWPAASPVQPGGFNFPYGAVDSPSPDPAPGWTIQPSLSLQILATDNYYQTRHDRRSEFVTTLTPGILVTADTARIRGIVAYEPALELHAYGNGDNGIYHNLNGQVLVTAIPETLFLDLRGSAYVQPAGGGYAAYGPTETSGRNQVQTSSFQLSPYLVRRFGGLATMQVGYAFQSVTEDTRDTSGVFLTPSGQPYYSDQSFTAHEFYAVVRTGENFGRLAMEARGISTDYNGSGVLDGAYRRIAAVEARYAINRLVAILGEIGYEEQKYNGIPPFHISEPVWSGGVRLSFSPDSFITARYGRHDGFNSARLDAVLSVGARTRIFANYSESLTTSAQRSVDLLSTTTLDELGNPVDAVTGAPSVLPFSNSLLGIQSGLMRVRSGSASISQNWDRDTFTLTFLREERSPVSIEPGTSAARQSGTSGSISWAHSLTPDTTAIGFLQYGSFDSPAYGNGDVYTIGASLVTELMPGLAATVQLTTSSRSDDTSGGRSLQNTVIAGLRKTF